MLLPPSGRKAFSVVELVVAILIIAVLMLISFTAVGNFRTRSEGSKCANNLRQIGAATVLYAADHQQELPFYYYVTEGGSTGSGAVTGTWYYNLAPYLGVPRTEIGPTSLSTERTFLGTAEARLTGPCVFTCPGHRRTEGNVYWRPHPMSWPAERPVSYAPPLDARASERPGATPKVHPRGQQYYAYRMSDVTAPSRKIWLSDSATPDILNTSDTRWQASEAYTANYARQGFSRHSEGGNALFYDGHVEWIPHATFSRFTGAEHRTIRRLHFDPYRTPEQDQ